MTVIYFPGRCYTWGTTFPDFVRGEVFPRDWNKVTAEFEIEKNSFYANKELIAQHLNKHDKEINELKDFKQQITEWMIEKQNTIDHLLDKHYQRNDATKDLDKAKDDFCEWILHHIPDNGERAEAFNCLSQCVFWLNKSLSRRNSK